jgi:Leu/Phe-tRNA-protein transferase
MEQTPISITYLPFLDISNQEVLEDFIYPDMSKNYYWSDDFSAEYYVAQAKAGFIAVTEEFEEELFLIPEIQYAYALLDFNDLHVSKKVQRLLKKKKFELEISQNLLEAYRGINAFHKNSWLKKEYLDTLNTVNCLESNCQIFSVLLKENGIVVAGELGYIIGKTYTSLSGFSSRKKEHKNFGTVQLVLLVKYLEANGFAFMNLGQPYMDYKLALGAKIYNREDFLIRWFDAI